MYTQIHIYATHIHKQKLAYIHTETYIQRQLFKYTEMHRYTQHTQAHTQTYTCRYLDTYLYNTHTHYIHILRDAQRYRDTRICTHRQRCKHVHIYADIHRYIRAQRYIARQTDR